MATLPERPAPAGWPPLRPVPTAPAGGAEAVPVVVVSEYRLVVDGVARAAGDGAIELLASASSVADGLAALRRWRPAVALVGDQLPDGSGLDVVRQLPAVAPGTAGVLMGVAGTAPAALVAALRAGCRGIVTREQSLDELVRSVHLVAAGGSALPAALGASLARRLERRAGPVTELTDRELEVLTAMAAGRSNQAIAQLLYLSPHTVRNHVKHVLAKLGAHSRLEAVAVAARLGLVRGPG